ncbi:MAG: hypothetical protein WC485_03360, partial [Opitutaceae bacterium]
RHTRADPVRREAGRWLRRLAESRRSKVEGREWRVEAGDVQADLQRLRYGPRETWPEPQAVFRRARRTLRAERRLLSWPNSAGHHGSTPMGTAAE